VTLSIAKFSKAAKAGLESDTHHNKAQHTTNGVITQHNNNRPSQIQHNDTDHNKVIKLSELDVITQHTSNQHDDIEHSDTLYQLYFLSVNTCEYC
jgi:hypothetical protein